MTSDLTTREVSQRLKEVGFECEHTHVVAVNPNGKVIYSSDPQEIQILMSVTDEVSPAYSASTLFEYMVDNMIFTIDAKGLALYHESIHDTFYYWDDYVEGHLADMLAEAIIWIKEKENK